MLSGVIIGINVLSLDCFVGVSGLDAILGCGISVPYQCLGYSLWLCNCYRIGDVVRSKMKIVIIETNKRELHAGVNLSKGGLK